MSNPRLRKQKKEIDEKSQRRQFLITCKVKKVIDDIKMNLDIAAINGCYQLAFEFAYLGIKTLNENEKILDNKFLRTELFKFHVMRSAFLLRLNPSDEVSIEVAIKDLNCAIVLWSSKDVVLELFVSFCTTLCENTEKLNSLALSDAEKTYQECIPFGLTVKRILHQVKAKNHHFACIYAYLFQLYIICGKENEARSAYSQALACFKTKEQKIIFQERLITDVPTNLEQKMPDIVLIRAWPTLLKMFSRDCASIVVRNSYLLLGIRQFIQLNEKKDLKAIADFFKEAFELSEPKEIDGLCRYIINTIIEPERIDRSTAEELITIVQQIFPDKFDVIAAIKEKISKTFYFEIKKPEVKQKTILAKGLLELQKIKNNISDAAKKNDFKQAIVYINQYIRTLNDNYNLQKGISSAQLLARIGDMLAKRSACLIRDNPNADNIEIATLQLKFALTLFKNKESRDEILKSFVMWVLGIDHCLIAMSEGDKIKGYENHISIGQAVEAILGELNAKRQYLLKLYIYLFEAYHLCGKDNEAEKVYSQALTYCRTDEEVDELQGILISRAQDPQLVAKRIRQFSNINGPEIKEVTKVDIIDKSHSSMKDMIIEFKSQMQNKLAQLKCSMSVDIPMFQYKASAIKKSTENDIEPCEPEGIDTTDQVQKLRSSYHHLVETFFYNSMTAIKKAKNIPPVLQLGQSSPHSPEHLLLPKSLKAL